jgi:hypothetical protein
MQAGPWVRRREAYHARTYDCRYEAGCGESCFRLHER